MGKIECMTALSFFRTAVYSVIGFVLVIAAHADPVLPGVKVSQFSGKPIPRFETLRYSAVHGRKGPSLEHPIVWRYEKQGLPVLVVRETHGWRRVRDHLGDEVWVQSRMLTEEPFGYVKMETVLRAEEDETAEPVAHVRAGTIPTISVCRVKACLVKIDRLKGWIDRSDLWGIAPDAAAL